MHLFNIYLSVHYVPGNRNTMENKTLLLPSRSSQSYYPINYTIKGNIKQYTVIQYKHRKNLESTTQHYLAQLLLQGPKVVSLH